MNKTRILWTTKQQTPGLYTAPAPSRNKIRYDAFLAAHPGLHEALHIDHRISMDLDAKLMGFGSLSEAQMALAFKLYSEAMCPARPAETNVAAPTGRQTIRGIVVSVKEHRSDFGDTLKMTVKVTTPTGTWLCWGTVPSSLTEAAPYRVYQSDPQLGPSTEVTKGTEVEFTATLTAGREKHFAFFKRPTNARIVTTQDAVPAAEVSPRPGVAGNVCAKFNAEMGLATRGYGS